MPISAANKLLYPDNWDEISIEIRFGRAAGRCECEGECRTAHQGGRCRAVHGLKNPETGSKVVLTTGHLDHTPENVDPDNLRAWCQKCHLRYDRDHHAATARATREAARTAGMTPLFGNLPDRPIPGPRLISADTLNPAGSYL